MPFLNLCIFTGLHTVSYTHLDVYKNQPLAQYGASPTDMNRLGWSDAGVIVPWVVWKQFGDTQIIDEKMCIRDSYS